MFEPIDLKQQPDAFPTWTSTGELYEQRGVGRFCVEKTLYEAATGVNSALRGYKCPTSRRPIKSTGLEIELTKHTVFS